VFHKKFSSYENPNYKLKRYHYYGEKQSPQDCLPKFWGAADLFKPTQSHPIKMVTCKTVLD